MKNIIITGGSRGIGRAIAEKLLDDPQVFVTATYAHSKVESFDPRIEYLKLDVTNSQEIEIFFQEHRKKHNGLYGLVNNAGIRKDSLGMLMQEEAWDQVIQTNLKGAFLMSQKALEYMLPEKFGRIVNIGSIGGNLCLVGQANYASSKAGLVALSKTLAKEVAKKGICVNCISPGFIETELLDDLSPELIQEYKKIIPMKRFGKASEVASAVAFLLSKDASYITGHNLEISGGM